MNILIIPSWYPQFEGDIGGSFFKEQAEQLAIHYPQNNFMVLQVQFNLSTKSWIKKFLTLNLKLQCEVTNVFHNLTEIRISNFCIPYFASPETKAAKRLHSILNKLEFYPNVIHAHSAWNGGYIAMELAKIAECKYLITEHMEPFPWQIPLFVNNNGKLTNKIRAPLENANAVIAVSNSLADRIAAFDIKRPVVLHNLVNEQKFKPIQKKKTRDSFHLLSIGALIPQKGMDILLNVFSEVCNVEPSLRLTIVGDGEQKNELIQLANELKIANLVNFVGLVNRNEIVDYYHNADCFVLASRGETFGVVYAEAIACGLPIIATRCGGSEDIINPKNGILTEINKNELSNAIIEIYRNQNKYDKVQIREDFLQRFSSNVICQQIMNIYKDLQQ
jgi:glycosyltransferase involved in cell wall biosynthesis